jgi:hypothetical protein
LHDWTIGRRRCTGIFGPSSFRSASFAEDPHNDAAQRVLETTRRKIARLLQENPPTPF